MSKKPVTYVVTFTVPVTVDGDHPEYKSNAVYRAEEVIRITATTT